MNVSLQSFCERCLTLHGVVASAVRSSDGVVYQRSAEPWFSPSQIQQAMTRLAVAAESLRHQAPDAQRICWTFEHIVIYLASRHDGAHLAVFLENRDTLPVAKLDLILTEFTNVSDR
jgi:hypothetical protein